MIPSWRIKLDVLVLNSLLVFACLFYLVAATWIPLMVMVVFFAWSAISELFYRQRYKWATCSVYCALLLVYLLGLGMVILLGKAWLTNLFLFIGLAFCIWFYQKSIRQLFVWINRPRSFWDLA